MEDERQRNIRVWDDGSRSEGSGREAEGNINGWL
jgi:hypothetical protein